MNKIFPVYTLKNECADCYKCVRSCPVKAIKVEDGHASVLSEKCIACGACVIACPSNAKRVRSDVEKVKNLLMTKNGIKKDVYVSLAPSWSGVFEFNAKKMIAVLKKLGFKGVSETALGAQEVSIETAKMLKNGPEGLYISSACPVVVDFIRLYHPEFTKNITPIASPALTHAKLLKKTFGDDINVVFIGPCIAKKNEADKNPDLINASLTFEELKFWINEEYINIENITEENENFVPEEAYEGSLYPIEGGMNETIKKIGLTNNDVQLLNLSSLDTIEKALNGFDKTKLKGKIFLETLACGGGCIGGPCISTKKAGLSIMSEILNNTKERQTIPKEAQAVVEIDYTTVPVAKSQFSVEEIAKALKRIGKYSPEDELNCGGCGYNTCREMVNALLKNEAEPSMCASYMRQIAHRKADALLRCMPSAMVMVDKDLKIVEANNSFIKMFCSDMYDIYSQSPDSLKGAAIERIVDFETIFKQALKSAKDIHKEHYPSNDRLYDITAFTIDKNELVGAIIVDVTKSQLNREKTAQRAQEVISKNIAIVQNIACLLGEHMVETELLLSTIAQDYEKDTPALKTDTTEEKK